MGVAMFPAAGERSDGAPHAHGHGHRGHEHEVRSARLEAFSDGVIAVIITIMVLELHVPAADGAAGLLAIGPRIGIYALSFMLVGIYWINHHELLRRTDVVDYRTMWANLLFLFALSLIPFATAYIGAKHFDTYSAALYQGVMIFTGITFLLLRVGINKLHSRHEPLHHQDRAEMVKHVLSIALYLLALLVAFLHPLVSLALNLLITFIWIAPEFGTGTGAICTVAEPESGAAQMERPGTHSATRDTL